MENTENREEYEEYEELTQEDMDRAQDEILDELAQEWEEILKRSEEQNARLVAQNPLDEEAYYRSGPGMVDKFMEAVQGDTFRPISSGIPSLDWAIGGGFIRQSVILLGAAPAMGKTALMSQICENIARAGEPVLYFNLEMSREVMIARSLSRIARLEFDYKVSSAEILQGYSWTDARRETIKKAVDAYKESIAKNLVYNPKDKITDLDEIIKEIDIRTKSLLAQGYKAPIICIDYLQLITGREGEDTVAVIKRAMMELKDYANKNRTLAFVIAANNRESAKTGRSDLNSGRDSSNIEYGADVHLGIEYDAISPKMQPDGKGGWTKGPSRDLDYIYGIRAKFMEWMRSLKQYGRLFESDYRGIDKEYKEVCTRYNIRVNKNRYSESGACAKLVFEGESSTFRELTEDEKRLERNRRASNLPRA